ncbi:MAG: NnrS family protein [Burkholderiaceae bacterium]|jgi:uncharacterized protein involved in response to NO|nr:NnrS family protein [Burkholderiaceae bacterium]
MPQLLRIEEPNTPRATAPGRPALPKVAPSWRAFWELGFRPLYLMGCFWGAMTVLLWVCAPQVLVGPLAGVVWHAHEMLWGFVATIAVGFLLTAGSNWTGITTLQGPWLAALCGLWALARIGYLISGAVGWPAFGIAALCELLFFLGAAAALARAIIQSRSQRNYGVPLLLLGLSAANALYLYAVWRGQSYALLMNRFDAGLLCMAVIALLIARRVTPFFASRAVAGLEIPMHTQSGQWQIAAGVLAIGCVLAGWTPGAALFLAATGALALWQVLSWRPWAVRRVPLLWILYVGYAMLGAGLLVAAAQTLGWITRVAWPAHMIGVGGFSALIIGMVTRTALGHLGRPLRADRSMVAAYALVLAAAALRLAALLPTVATLCALHAAAAAWVAAFGLYLWRFFPMMIRPRADRAPQKTPVRIPVRMSR